jgi:hypothetical protein
MKKLIVAFTWVTFILFGPATAQVKLPSPAPTQTIKQDFGMGSIELTYSRPGARGRMVFGDLVRNGQLWRTGANEATRLVFTTPVEIGGRKIDSGTYVLYTIPDEESWQIIINRGINNWGIEGYKESEDVVNFTAPVVKTSTKIETFTMQFANVTPQSCELQLMWDKKIVALPITTNIVSKLKAQIEAAMLTDEKPYWVAAQFYFEYDKSLSKALENVNKATEENPKAFYMFFYKARIQKEMGKNADAMATSKISLALSKEAKNEDYVKMNQQLQKEIRRAVN